MEHCCPLVHAEHVAPPVPHDVPDCAANGTHAPVAPPLQHPFAQEVASHTHWPLVVLHSSPEPHAAHATPPAPQEPLFSLAYGSHVPLLQHPAQTVPPQVHDPIEHDSPLAHEPHVAPAVPQEVPLCAANGSHEPVGPPAQQPFAHDVESQMHAPALHSRPEPHAAQATPPLPHSPLLSAACVMQCPLEQQPSEQFVALQTPCWSGPTSAIPSGWVPDVTSCPPSPVVDVSGPPSPSVWSEVASAPPSPEPELKSPSSDVQAPVAPKKTRANATNTRRILPPNVPEDAAIEKGRPLPHGERKPRHPCGRLPGRCGLTGGRRNLKERVTR